MKLNVKHVKTFAADPSQRGVGLVEIMVALVIGLIGILVIMQTYMNFEGQKRTSTGGADAQESGLIALYTIERDLRMAGMGMMLQSGLGCSVINAYNADRTAPLTPDYQISLVPVRITRDTPTAGTDTITVQYSSSPYASMSTTLTDDMPNSSVILNVKNGIGFSEGNLVLLAPPGGITAPCSVVQLSQDGQRTAGGTTWNLQHNPGAGFPYNPPGGHNIFPISPPAPITGYPPGSRAVNMGSLVLHEYSVVNEQLILTDLNAPLGATNPQVLAHGIVAIQAQYGRDTNSNGFLDASDTYDAIAPTSATEVLATRIAVVARSGQMEKTAVTTGPLTLWKDGTVLNGGALNINGTDGNYRYKLYQTVAPHRNVIWGDN